MSGRERTRPRRILAVRRRAGDDRSRCHGQPERRGVNQRPRLVGHGRPLDLWQRRRHTGRRRTAQTQHRDGRGDQLVRALLHRSPGRRRRSRSITRSHELVRAEIVHQRDGAVGDARADEHPQRFALFPRAPGRAAGAVNSRPLTFLVAPRADCCYGLSVRSTAEIRFRPGAWRWLIGLGLAAGLPILPASAATLTRGPYLQLGTPTSIVVRWRTDTLASSRVRYGAESANLNFTADDAASVANHIVTLSNLTPDTVYFYSIGSPTETLAAGTNYFFRSAPSIGSQRPIRIWVLGDSGMTNMSAGPVRDAYYAFTGPRYTDVWLMVGDTASHGGIDNVCTAPVFNTYPTLLRQTVLWSCIGNQETFNLPTGPPTLPYFDILSLPMNGEAGGVASGTEKYYSFDYGNIRFICLDSMSSARTNGSPMLTWLEADLAAYTNQWLIAFWHHPPYSKEIGRAS